MTEGTQQQPVRKQRMGAPRLPVAEASAEVNGQTTAAHVTAAPTEAQIEAQPAPEAAPRRMRMGAAPQPAPQHAAAAVPTAPGPPVTARTRMGAGGATPTRSGVGVAPAAGEVTSAAVGSAGGRTRMGGSTPDPAPVSVAAPTSAVGQSRLGGVQPAAAAPTPTPAPTNALITAGKPARESGPWKKRIIWIVAIVVVAAAFVLLARWLRELPSVAQFVAQYPGTPTMLEATPEGVPGWMGWQHFFNMFFMVLIVRTGLQVRNEKKAPGYFTPKKNSFFSPKGATPKKVSFSQWTHQALDVFWMLNGLIFIVLLFATNQWLRIVPTHWDAVPNALSAGLQYASLDWPSENGWIHYNALQMIAYTTTVFIAAPLAIISGIRFSTWWPDKNSKLSRWYPVEVARAVHFPVMLYFVAFTLVHIMLVFLTGVLRNLNHMYTSRDVSDWLGLVVFLGSLVVIAAAWVFSKPLFMRPIAQRFGTLTK